MADKKWESESKPRLLQTSQKAGKELGLESDQSLIPRPVTGAHYKTRPSSMRNLDQRVREAEKQVVEEIMKSAEESRVVELALKDEEHFSEDLESQTLGNKNKMVEKKQMIVPGS